MSRRTLTILVAVMLVATACAAGTDPDTAEVPTGDAAAFCYRWPEARGALAESFDRANEWEIQFAVESTRRALDEIDPLVPAALRTDWSTAAHYQDTVITLLDIAGFQPERLPETLVDAAFGDEGGTLAEAASAAAIGVIDVWAIEQCGDFCLLWPRLKQALAGLDHESMIAGGPENEALLQLAEPLVPDEIRVDWDAAAAITLATIDLYRAAGWDPPWDREGPGRISYDEYPQAVGVTEERWQELTGTDEGWHDPQNAVFEVAGAHRDRIQRWSAANCEETGTSGLPGTVELQGSNAGWETWLLAALPRGTDVSQIEDASDFLAVACSESHWTGSEWAATLLTRDSKFDEPCTYVHRPDMGARQAVLPAGEYDLFVATFPNGPGTFGLYVPAPDRCAVIPFTIDGDTQVTVPQPGPCDLEVLSGTPEEIARRQPPTAPTGPSGTLRVVLTEYFPDDDLRHGIYRIVVVPGGTTLNEIGRGEAWPVGQGGMGWQPLEEVDPRIRAVIATDGVPVPIYSFGLTDLYVTGPEYLESAANVPDPITLAAGDYDVHIQVEAENEAEAWLLCSTVTATVLGDTVVVAPPLEDCS